MDKYNKINKLYEKLNYFDQYGATFILFIIITIIIILILSYIYTLINIQPIINDWPNQRCKPNIIPFAGYITHPEGTTASDYTFENFNYCTQQILSNITGYAVEPITFTTNLLQNIADSIRSSIQSIRAMFNKIRLSFQDVSQEIMGRLLNIMIPLQQIIIGFRDLIGKIQGAMTSALFTLLGSYYTLKSLLGAIAQFIVIILIAIAALVAAFWAIPFTWGAAIANTVIFIAISIPFAIILAFMYNVLHVSQNYKIPKIKCFDKNTLLKMNDGSFKKIININIGDILENNNLITAKIKITTENSIMYNLNNIIVSDSHIVKYNNNWIPVSKHPQAFKIKNYNEPFLYCLNTNDKIININGIIFTDWDEIYQDNLNKIILKGNLISSTLFKTKDIHKYFDHGFSPNTLINIKNPIDNNKLLTIPIRNININSILENGDIVYGIVEIKGDDLLEQYNYKLSTLREKYISSYSLNLSDKLKEKIDKYLFLYNIEGYFPYISSLSKEECMIENKVSSKNITFNKLSNKHNKLYHLLTNNGNIIINNKLFKDYNFAIDRFLVNNN
jgi:hypothetical protein